MALSKEHLQGLLKTLGDTALVEIDCDTCLQLVGEYAEIILHSATPATHLLAVEQHLKICPECREEFVALCTALRAMNPSPPSAQS